jgi:hypothetical protein
MFGSNVTTINPCIVTGNAIFQRDFHHHLLFGENFHRWKIVAVSNRKSRVLAQILLGPNAFPDLPLKLCGMNQWIFQPLLQLFKQSADDFHG